MSEAWDKEKWDKLFVEWKLRQQEEHAGWVMLKTHLTQLHYSASHGDMKRFGIIETQGRKIRGLCLQMKQMHRGYRKKIARLERRIAELEQVLGEPPA